MRRALFALVFLAGCPDPEQPEVELYAITNAPPASRAVVVNDTHNDNYSIELSTGVAIAAQCWSSCNSTCMPIVTVSDGALLEVRPVFRANGSKSEVALIAKRPGTATLRVDSGCATRTYYLSVVPR